MNVEANAFMKHIGGPYKWRLPPETPEERLAEMLKEMALEEVKEIIRDVLKDFKETIQWEIRLFLLTQDPLFQRIKNEIEGPKVIKITGERIPFDPSTHTYGRMVNWKDKIKKEFESDCCGAEYKLSVFGEKWECCDCGHNCQVILSEVGRRTSDTIRRKKGKER